MKTVLGRGTAAIVETARWRGGVVARKQARRRRDKAGLAAEARALRDVRHPAVIEVLDVCDDGSVLLPKAEGSLADVLALGPLSPGAAAAVGLRLADGIAAFARRGLVHGDVSPGNVLIIDGRPVLADPGRPGHGTPPYVAPECVRGADPAPAADVHAVAAVVLECLTGVRPDDVVSTLAALAVDVPAGVRSVLGRGVAPDAASRPTATGLAAALAPWADADLHLAVGTAVDCAATVRFGPRPPSLVRPDLVDRRRAVSPVVVAVAALLAVVGLGHASSESAPIPSSHEAACSAAAVPTTANPLVADTDGDGCLSSISYDPATGEVVVSGRRFATDLPGATARVGDWDCDGVDTLALVTGAERVAVFDTWPGDDTPARGRYVDTLPPATCT